jgi:hypothetical protein
VLNFTRMAARAARTACTRVRVGGEPVVAGSAASDGGAGTFPEGGAFCTGATTLKAAEAAPPVGRVALIT